MKINKKYRNFLRENPKIQDNVIGFDKKQKKELLRLIAVSNSDFLQHFNRVGAKSIPILGILALLSVLSQNTPATYLATAVAIGGVVWAGISEGVQEIRAQTQLRMLDKNIKTK